MGKEWAKVLIGTPTYEEHSYCLEVFAKSLHELTYEDFDVLLVDNSKSSDYSNYIRSMMLPVVRYGHNAKMRERMTECRNFLRTITLRGKYDYLMFLDQDVILPRDAISRLLRHNKKIISGIYTKKAFGKEWAFIVMHHWGPKKWVDIPVVGTNIAATEISEIEGKSLVQIQGAGYGCLMIHREVLEKIKFRYDPSYFNDSDVFFAMDIKKAGYKMYADCEVRCKHFYFPKDFENLGKLGKW